jgi:VWFA-related protein
MSTRECRYRSLRSCSIQVGLLGLLVLNFGGLQNVLGQAGAQAAAPQPQAATPKAAAAQTAADKNPAEMSSRDTPATFKAKVNLVLVPVVVRDAQGRAIGTLRQEDFQVFDKGKPQVITKFAIEKAGQVDAGRQGARENQNSTVAPGEKPAEKGAPLAMPERYVAYVFDDVHLAFGDLSRVREATDRHLASLEAVDRAAIYTTSGQTTLDFTDDRDKLRQTLVRLQPRPISRSTVPECPDISYYQADLIQNKSDSQALQAATLEAMACMSLDPNQIAAAEQAARGVASRVLSSGEHETRVSLTVFKDVVRRISAMPGQRSVILISPGFFAPSDLLVFKTDVIERAIHSNVIISALDARGLYAIVPGGDASQPSPFPLTAGIKAGYQSESALVEGDVLAELAEGTGGLFFHNSNDLDAGLKRVATAPEYVYVLGFSPQNLKLDGSFHKLKVTLKDSGKVNMQARRGYYAPKHIADPEEMAKQEIEDAVFSREELRDLPVELHTQFFKFSDENARVAVLARVDLRQMRYRKADGRNKNNLTVVSALFDRNGNYITASEKIIEMRLRDETLENKQRSAITVRTSFDVKPGSYLVRLVVRDAEGQQMAAQNGAVEIP